MNELQALISGNIYVFLIVFARVGAAFMMMPGLGEKVAPEYIRLYIALGFALVITPAVAPLIGVSPPSSPFLLMLFLARETLVGFFMGFIARCLMTALNTAGMIISFKMSLSSASMFNPQMAEQTTVVSALLTVSAVAMLFASDLHHMLIKAVYHSYDKFPPTGEIVLNDMAVAAAETVNVGFVIALEFTAPFIIISFALQYALGIIARLIPQIQVFFLGVPIQVVLGLAMMSATISACMYFFLDRFADYFGKMFG